VKYDYYLAGRWRNFKKIEPVLEKLRQKDNKVYCFIENEYDGHGVRNRRSEKHVHSDMEKTENLKDWWNNPTFRKIYEIDMQALRDSKAIVTIFPIGYSGHMELGAAYGMGKKCYGIGEPEKAETLYFMFDKIFPNIEAFMRTI
jgi:hypothetical protein